MIGLFGSCTISYGYSNPFALVFQLLYTKIQVTKLISASSRVDTDKQAKLFSIVSVRKKSFSLVFSDYGIYLCCALAYYAFLLMLCQLIFPVNQRLLTPHGWQCCTSTCANVYFMWLPMAADKKAHEWLVYMTEISTLSNAPHNINFVFRLHNLLSADAIRLNESTTMAAMYPRQDIKKTKHARNWLAEQKRNKTTRTGSGQD